MRGSGIFARRSVLGVLCAGLVAAGTAAPAPAAPPEPDFIFFPNLLGGSPPPPDLQGPCGAAVSASGEEVYFANYYRHTVDLYRKPPPYLPASTYASVLANVDPLDGPCGLSLDSTGHLYVNNYHRNVERFTLGGGVFQTPTVIDSSHPTGVAVDLVTDDVYVNARTYVAAYDSSGAPILDGGDPLRIGEASLGDGYGLAVSAFPATAGRIYVPDHDEDVVEVYDPAVDVDDPVQTITGPPGGFGSLRDSAVAVDRVTGEVYVADTHAYPQYTERPEATIHVFDHAGGYEGRLKYNVVDGSPPGLAVDNSEDEEDGEIVPGLTQGRVYVTFGNSVQAGVYVYPPGSVTDLGVPISSSAGPSAPDAEQPNTNVADGTEATASTPTASTSVISQKGKLRVAVSGKLAPKRRPRKGRAPISISSGGGIRTTDQGPRPELRTMRIELHRGGRMDATGLPVCEFERIQPGSSSRALSACRQSLVGTGSFTADITLAGQQAYPTSGKLLVFNGSEGGKPVLYGHIYSRHPFASSFVIVFRLRKIRGGTYGTALDASLPAALGNWGNLTGLEMTLSRRYSYRGKPHSYISAGCPAPEGFTQAIFPLARTSFSFEGGARLTSVFTSTCKTRG